MHLPFGGEKVWALEKPVLVCVEVYDNKINLLSIYNRYRELSMDLIDVNEYTSFK